MVLKSLGNASTKSTSTDSLRRKASLNKGDSILSIPLTNIAFLTASFSLSIARSLLSFIAFKRFISVSIASESLWMFAITLA